MNLTPEMLADLRKKAEASTPGPWFPHCDYQWDLRWLGNDKGHASVATSDGAGLVDREICRFQVHGDGAGVYDQADLKQVAADIEHIAAANPTVVLALLDRIDALERNAEALRENDRTALEQLAHALGWKDGGPGWQAALDAIVELRARIEALNES